MHLYMSKIRACNFIDLKARNANKGEKIPTAHSR